MSSVASEEGTHLRSWLVPKVRFLDSTAFVHFDTWVLLQVSEVTIRGIIVSEATLLCGAAKFRNRDKRRSSSEVPPKR